MEMPNVDTVNRLLGESWGEHAAHRLPLSPENKRRGREEAIRAVESSRRLRLQIHFGGLFISTWTAMCLVTECVALASDFWYTVGDPVRYFLIPEISFHKVFTAVLVTSSSTTFILISTAIPFSLFTILLVIAPLCMRLRSPVKVLCVSNVTMVIFCLLTTAAVITASLERPTGLRPSWSFYLIIVAEILAFLNQIGLALYTWKFKSLRDHEMFGYPRLSVSYV